MTKYYLPQKLEDLELDIKETLRSASEVADDLLKGASKLSVYSGTGLGLLDATRAHFSAGTSDDYHKSMITQAVVSLHESHNSFASFLFLYFLSRDLGNSAKEIMMNSEPPSLPDANSFYDSIIRNKRLKDLFSKIRERGGSSSIVETKVYSGREDTVTTKRKNSYPLSLPEEYWRYANRKEINHYEAHVLAVDGVIMTVGEIHGFLDKAHRTKEPLIILCRGFSEEVFATVLKNYSMGKVSAYLIQAPTSMSSNLLYDVAYLSGAHVVSTITGDVLNAKDETCLGSLKNVKFLTKGVEFEAQEERVSALASKIRKEQEGFRQDFSKDNVLEFESIFKERRRAASGEKCFCYISNSDKRGEITKDRLSSLLRLHYEIKETGLVDLDKLDWSELKALKDRGIKHLPVVSFIKAYTDAKSIKQILSTSGVVLRLDRAS